MVTDPIADMLTRIRNALMAGHEAVTVPLSRQKMAIARALKQEGFIDDYEVLRGKPQRMLRLRFKYTTTKEPLLRGLQRVSRPGMRVYVKRGEIPRVYGGLGVAILSTPRGVMSGEQAWRRRLGGELLCYVW